MFIEFSDKNSSYMYNAKVINTIQRPFEADYFIIQFESGVIQEYIFNSKADCQFAYNWIRKQLTGEIN